MGRLDAEYLAMSSYVDEAIRLLAIILGVSALVVAGYFADLKTISRQRILRYLPYILLLFSWMLGAAAGIPDIHLLIALLFGLSFFLQLLNWVAGRSSPKPEDNDKIYLKTMITRQSGWATFSGVRICVAGVPPYGCWITFAVE